jgi:hypothetical protein
MLEAPFRWPIDLKISPWIHSFLKRELKDKLLLPNPKYRLKIWFTNLGRDDAKYPNNRCSPVIRSLIFGGRTIAYNGEDDGRFQVSAFSGSSLKGHSSMLSHFELVNLDELLFCFVLGTL